MSFNLNVIAAAALALAGSAAHAALERMNTGNGAITFVALDANGTPASLMVDLGYLLSDADPLNNPAGALLQAGQTFVWNFNNNSLTVNGIAQTGTYNWSAQYAAFQAAAQAGDTRYGVIAGATGGFPEFFLTSGNPTPSQLEQQTIALTANMGVVDTLFANNVSKGTFPLAGEGAAAVVGSTSAASGYLGAAGNFGTAGNWRTNLKWNALVTEGTTNDFYFMNGDSDDETRLGGQFSYAAGVLTWQTDAPVVPEPSTYALALMGLGIVGFVARRRRAAR
ncbi:MAG: PEP-CTERM sorting domain-containing protein [Aquabacterium sp.]